MQCWSTEPTQRWATVMMELYVSQQCTLIKYVPFIAHPHPYQVFIKVSVMKLPLTAEQCLLTKHKTWRSPSTLIPPPVCTDRFPRFSRRSKVTILWYLQMLWWTLC